MRIDIYNNYKITSNYEGTYISQEDSTPNDIVFSKFANTKEEIINGGELLERIGKKLLDNEISEIHADDNFVKLEFFNPTNGESSTINIVYEVIESLGEDKKDE